MSHAKIYPFAFQSSPMAHVASLGMHTAVVDCALLHLQALPGPPLLLGQTAISLWGSETAITGNFNLCQEVRPDRWQRRTP